MNFIPSQTNWSVHIRNIFVFLPQNTSPTRTTVPINDSMWSVCITVPQSPSWDCITNYIFKETWVVVWILIRISTIDIARVWSLDEHLDWEWTPVSPVKYYSKLLSWQLKGVALPFYLNNLTRQFYCWNYIARPLEMALAKICIYKIWLKQRKGLFYDITSN